MISCFFIFNLRMMVLKYDPFLTHSFVVLLTYFHVLGDAKSRSLCFLLGSYFLTCMGLLYKRAITKVSQKLMF